MKKRLLSLALLFILLALAGTGLIACGKEKVVEVATKDELINAITTNSGEVIRLTSNIDSETSIDIVPESKNVSFKLDMNGYNINAIMKLNNGTRNSAGNAYEFSNYGINAKIYNSSKDKKSQIGSLQSGYGYGLTINSNDKVEVELNNITSAGYYSGIGTNGLCSGAKISAKNCEFLSATGTESAGAYFGANYTYNFENCTFTGDSGYYTKSGTHTLKTCTVNGNGAFLAPTYYGNGFNPTGSAIVIDSAVNYFNTLNVTIDGGSYSSTNAYGLEEVSTAPQGASKVSYASITIKNDPTFTGALGETSSENNKLAA